MRRVGQRKKNGGKVGSEFQLNRSISTYGKIQTRLVTDLPNYNWLPSDDSLPIESKPNILVNVTNQQPWVRKNHESKPCKAPKRNVPFGSDSDDDFRFCRRPKRTRQLKRQLDKDKALPPSKKCERRYQKKKRGKDSAADKENHISIKDTENMHNQNCTSDGVTQKKWNRKEANVDGHDEKNRHLSKVPHHNMAHAPIVLEPSDDGDSHQIPLSTVPKLAVTDISIVNKNENHGSLILNKSTGLAVVDASVGVELSDIAPSPAESLVHTDVENLSIKNGDLPGLHASAEMQRGNEVSTDLFSSQSFKPASIIIRNPALNIELGMLPCSDGPKSPASIQPFNSTVIGHAADFEITDESACQMPKHAHSISSKPVLIQSTPLVNSRKLKMNLIAATDPRITLKDSISASVVVEQNKAVKEKIKTSNNKFSKPNRNTCKPKVAKRNQPKKVLKPKQFSKRLANKCNRSIRSSDNNSILQHIMVGNPIKQYQYEFLENSQDAYFVDTFSKSVEGVQLGKNPKNQRSQADNDQVVSHNCSVTEASSDYVNTSVAKAFEKNVRPNLNTPCYSSKKKCLRKRVRIDYKLMLSGSWYIDDFRNHSIPDEAKLRCVTNGPTDTLPVCNGKKPTDSDDNSCDDDLKVFHQHLKQGNINQRRKRKPIKPASDSSLFSPLTLSSHARIHSNHMQSPQFHSRENKVGTPKLSRCGIRSRSPGSHLKTPMRVISRTRVNSSKFNDIDTLSESLGEASHNLEERSISTSIFHLTTMANQSPKVLKQSLGFAKALSPVGNRSSSLVNESLTEKQKLLMECNQLEPIKFETVLSCMDLHSCRKLGEGVFGEVYGLHCQHVSERIAMKVIPIEGDLIINGERQKSCREILPEILGSKELSKLSTGLDYATDGFITLHTVHCVNGKYPDRLLQAWDTYNEDECSQNDRPDSFRNDQLYILLLYSDGGTDVEHYKFRSATQAYSVIQQVCAALAVAEKTLEFEHRDLHWGNVLVTPTKSKEVNFTFDRKCYKIQTNGVKVNIIDFTLSRLSKDGVTVYQDLSSDPDIFNGDVNADYQFEIYRLMKEEIQNDWSCFSPRSNIFWLHYLVVKFVKEVKYSNMKSSRHISFLSKCRFLSKTLFDYNSCSLALFSCPKLSL